MEGSNDWHISGDCFNIQDIVRGDNVKKEELEQLNDLHKEIAELEAAIVRLRQQKTETATDKVRASGKYFPYVNGYKTISGFNMAADGKRKELLDKKELILMRRKRKAEETELRIMEYINSVQDSKIRRIMQYRFIDGYKWDKIGKIIHCDRTYPKKLIDNYLEENEKNSDAK